MNRFKQSFSRFMYGRYGMDQLSRCLSYVVLVLIILTFFLRSNVIYTVALLGIVYIYFRMFSRNISRRSAENQKYMKIHYKFMRLHEAHQRMVQHMEAPLQGERDTPHIQMQEMWTEYKSS